MSLVLLGRVPYLTLAIIAALLGTFVFWQGGESAGPATLLAQGANHGALVAERGQAYRLLTGVFLHASPWHLGANLFFFLNVGGPLEAVFRRRDYGLIVVLSALGGSGLSALFTPGTSCGASGVVFGAWAALVVFGWQHRALLPARYRRYFLGALLPYAIFSLYAGLAIPQVDIFGHLGGLLAGGAAAVVLPARLSSVPPRARLFAAAFGAVPVALLMPAFFPLGPGPLLHDRFLPKGGLSLPVPERWKAKVSRYEDGHETYAFDNGAGVALALDTRLLDAPQGLVRSTRLFVEGELHDELERVGALGMRLSDPQPAQLAGLPAMRLTLELATADGRSRHTYMIAQRGYYRYVVSASTPAFLAEAYEPLLAAALADARLARPSELWAAETLVRAVPTGAAQARLALAHLHAGEPDEAHSVLAAAERRFGLGQGVAEAKAEAARPVLEEAPPW